MQSLPNTGYTLMMICTAELANTWDDDDICPDSFVLSITAGICERAQINMILGPAKGPRVISKMKDLH